MNKTLRYLTVFVLLLITTHVYSQKINTTEYVKKYKSLAIAEMDKFNIPASIILAQGILESGNGNSRLAKNGKNHFGIKCHNNWDGKTIRWNDDSKRECFRKYKSVAESYRDHSEFLSTRGHYSPLFNHKITDYKAWAKGLQKAGYATNNKYATLLIRIIEENELQRFDNPKLYAQNANQKASHSSNTQSDSDFEPIEICGTNRPLYTNNGVKFIFAEAGDSFKKIARELNIYTWQVYKYNDLKKDDTIVEGQMIYVQKKKRKASQKYHLTKANESLYSIAQLYGIQLKTLLNKNKLEIADSAQIGQQLKLR